MACKLNLEARMTVMELDRRGVSRSAIARTLQVTEGAVRYHLRRQAQGAVDGRAKVHRARPWHAAIARWIAGPGAGCRVETPPGAQGQVDWAHFPAVRIYGETLDL
jgi:hypothetical protein